MKEIDGFGGRARVRKDDTFHLSPADAKAAVAANAGFIVPDMAPGRRDEGYRCTSCGFGSWFRRCSKCGAECERE